MNRKEAERLTRQADTLRALGFTPEEAESLRRISMTLRRWHELECGVENGCIERDEKTGRPYWHNSYSDKCSPVADREKGALKRLGAIIKARNERPYKQIANGRPWRYTPKLTTYIQTDPRGAALYIIRPGDIPEGHTVESCYSRGICVY